MISSNQDQSCRVAGHFGAPSPYKMDKKAPIGPHWQSAKKGAVINQQPSSHSARLSASSPPFFFLSLFPPGTDRYSEARRRGGEGRCGRRSPISTVFPPLLPDSLLSSTQESEFFSRAEVSKGRDFATTLGGMLMFYVC